MIADVSLPFVVLRHEGVPEPHFDFMFDNDAVGEHRRLITFRVPVWPIVSRVAVEKLHDHRVDYLTYEGAVSGGRGWVRRVDEGHLSFRIRSDGLLIVFTRRPSLELRRSGNSWVAEPVDG